MQLTGCILRARLSHVLCHSVSDHRRYRLAGLLLNVMQRSHIFVSDAVPNPCELPVTHRYHRSLGCILRESREESHPVIVPCLFTDILVDLDNQELGSLSLVNPC